MKKLAIVCLSWTRSLFTGFSKNRLPYFSPTKQKLSNELSKKCKPASIKLDRIFVVFLWQNMHQLLNIFFRVFYMYKIAVTISNFGFAHSGPRVFNHTIGLALKFKSQWICAKYHRAKKNTLVRISRFNWIKWNYIN